MVYGGQLTITVIFLCVYNFFSLYALSSHEMKTGNSVLCKTAIDDDERLKPSGRLVGC